MATTPSTQPLIGLPPDIFDRNRSCSRAFLTQFRIFARINRRHRDMTYPYCPIGEALWDEFIRNFTAVWIDDPVTPSDNTSAPLVFATAVDDISTPENEDNDDDIFYDCEDDVSSAPTPTPSSSIVDLVRPVEEPVHLSTPTAPTVPRIEKRKRHDTSDPEETRPSKSSRTAPHIDPPRASPQLGQRSVPLPRKYAFAPRRTTSVPATNAPSFIVPYSPPPRRPPDLPDNPDHAPPLVDPDPRPLAPDRTVVEGDNTLTGGVKTLEDSVFAPVSDQDDTESPPQTPPHARLFPRHAFERPRDLDELTTRVINRQRRGSTRVPYPTTPRNHARRTQNAINRHPGDVPPTPVASRHTTEQCCANAAAAPPHSPSVATNAQPVDHRTRRRTTDSNSLNGTPAEPDSHTKPQQARPHRTPEHKHIRAETTEATPAINRANAAVEMFLRRYDAARPTPAPATAPASHTYDAVLQHLDYHLATDPDTTRITQSFALRPGPRAILHKWKKK
ncbi:hypothetical protein EDB89DRAFT_1908454 [Lactarius sanguifluus]|nr:hypothetical protein EDB89DRAFT_1908454 [Lactarius sanguifluus]